VSFNTRRIVALVVMLLGSTCGGLLAVAFTDSRLAAIVGVVLGAVALRPEGRGLRCYWRGL
jgi:uncharacterized membrane protein YfcA